jgi:hypothetical protein
MIDQAAAQQTVTAAIQATGAAASSDRAALIAGIQQLTAVVSQLAQLGGHITTGGMAAHVLEWAKGKPGFSAFWDDLSNRAKVVWAAGLAAIPAAGIVFTFSHPSDGHFILEFEHLTLATFGVFLWSFMQNWFAQQAYYQSVLKARTVSGPSEKEQAKPSPPPPVPVVAVQPQGVPNV